MVVYRITLDKYADLSASGNPARWNPRHTAVIYTACSRALACLENVVHRSSLGLNHQFTVLLINIPNSLKIQTIEEKDLMKGWSTFDNMPYTQQLGDNWVTENKYAVLRVPSVIIPGEWNYLINPGHPDFKKINLVAKEPFVFDKRIKE